MDIRKTLSLFTHLLALTGYLSLILSSSSDTAIILIYLTVLFGSLYFDFFKNKYLLNKFYCNALAVLLIIFLGVRVFLFNEELIVVLIYFIVYIQLIKFLGKKESKDYEQIVLISFFQLLAGAVTTTKLFYGILLVVFILFSVITIFLFNIYNEQYGIKDGVKKDPKFNYRTLFSSGTVIWLSVVVLSLSVFLLMPRFKGNFLTSSLLNKQKLSTGFNDEIELGQVGEIKKDSSPVMRVKFLNKTKKELPEIIYWRGVALDYFDGKLWTQRFKNQKSRIAKNYDGLFIIDKSKKDDIAIQEIVAEPIDTDVLFAANSPVAFGELPFRSLYTVNNSYYHSGHFTNNIKYLAYSDINYPDSSELEKINNNYPDDIILKYAGPFAVSLDIEEFSYSFYDENLNQYQIVKSVEQYLKNNLSYTRVLENSGDSPPLDQFLFDGKQGHCEYFATAMTVILREMEIPSRLVTGFIGGEYNRIGEYYLIRENDAHAWVEVFFPGSGWVTFDPTPGNDTDFYTGFNVLTGSLEYLRYRWNRYVVDYGVNDQRRLLKNISNRSAKFNFNLSSKLKLNNPRSYFAVIALILLLIIIYYSFKNKIPSLIKREANSSQASATYKKSVKLMKKKGFIKGPGITSKEFAEYIESKDTGKYKEFSIITNIYNSIKFSGVEDKKLYEKLKASYNRLKRQLQKEQ